MRSPLGIILAFIFLVVLGLAAAVQIGSGDYVMPAFLLGIILLLLTGLFFGERRPIEGVFIVVAVCCYIIFGKGFAYQRLSTYAFVGESLLAFGMLMYVMRVYKREFSLVPRSSMAWALLPLGIYSLIHVVIDYERHQWMALRDSCVIYYTIFFFIVYQLARFRQIADYAAKAFICIAPLAVIIEMMMKFTPGLMMKLQFVKLGSAPLFLPHMDALTNAVFGLIFFLIFRHSQTGRFLPLLGAVVLIGWEILFARGAAYIVLFCTGIFLVFARQWRSLMAMVPMILLAGVCGLVLMELIGSKQDRALQKIQDQWSAIVNRVTGEGHSGTMDDDTADWRIEWWKKITRDVTSQNPLFGLGFGEDISTPFHQQYFRTSVSGEEVERTRGAHNIVFTILARGGWIGVVLFALVIIVQLIYFRRAARLAADGQIPPRYMFLWGASLSGFVIGFFQYAWEASYAAIPYWTYVAIAYATLDREMEGAEAEESSGEQAEAYPVAGAWRPLAAGRQQ